MAEEEGFWMMFYLSMRSIWLDMFITGDCRRTGTSSNGTRLATSQHREFDNLCEKDSGNVPQAKNYLLCRRNLRSLEGVVDDDDDDAASTC